MDWIEDGTEQELPNVAEEDADDEENEIDNQQMDMGPSPDQVFDVLEEEEYTEEVSGSIPGSRGPLRLSREGQAVLCEAGWTPPALRFPPSVVSSTPTQ